ncbi:BTAD domain-containing putative transcriptional regulator [Kitasatospora sp. NPDC048365]|uniref:AfsR/SARP family transcriptional regulator n=1 Tax=Kitasatospora sp. NPDC048365 TaxID=3364050 RepID=UPI00371B99A7
MRIRLLGPVELRTGPVGFTTVSGAQRRAVLALLALDLGRVVPVERLCEVLWGDRPPTSARAAVQGHVAALRKLLVDAPFELHTRDGGYLLTGPADDVDALRFEALAARTAGHADAAGPPEDAEDAEAVALLEEALRLWRGEALADLPDTPLRTALVDHLNRTRTDVLLRWAALQLRRGTGAAAVAALEQHVRTDGLREELVALLMRCLHRAGRPADALTAYHRARRRLDRELGIRPGPALQAALAEVLADDGPDRPAAAAAPTRPAAAASPTGPTTAAAPAVHVPGRLPRRPTGFAGRRTELDRLDRAGLPGRTAGGPILVTGPPGVGKSALAVVWAHRAAARFPDGLLYADLRGLTVSGPARPEDVLADFLHELGVPAGAVPAGRADRARLFRERTAGRRLLVVLDDADGADQVVDLLPQDPGCVTVVTGRGPLQDLLALDGAVVLQLAALPQDDALLLLEGALTPERVHADPRAAARLVRLCDRLPLALRIAAARLAAQPGWALSAFADELADEQGRSTALSTDGAFGVHSRLDLTCRRLSAPAADLLAALAAHPGDQVDALTGAALLGTDTPAARRALDELAAHHLLTGAGPGRYGRAPLVRPFGAGLLAERAEPLRRLPGERLADYVLAVLRRCGRFLDPWQEGAGAPAHPPQALPDITDIRAALDWFRAEEPTVRALTEATARTDPGRAWQLALFSGALHHGLGRFTAWLDCADAGRRAAEQCGDPVPVALLHDSRARALIALERPPEAAEAARRAVAVLDAAEGPGAAAARIRSLATLGLATALVGDHTEAERLTADALALALATGEPRHLVEAKVHQGRVALAAGDPEGARRRSWEARDLLPAVPLTRIHLWCLLTEARTLAPTLRDDTADLLWHRLLVACGETGLLDLHAAAERSYAAHLTARHRAWEADRRLRAALAHFRAEDRRGGAPSEITTGLAAALGLDPADRPAQG